MVIANNNYFNLVFWGVGNKTGEYSPIMVNLSDGAYNALSSAENDVNGYDNFAIPTPFIRDSSTGFLICRMTFKKTVTS